MPVSELTRILLSILLSISTAVWAESPIIVNFTVEEEAPLHTTIGNVSRYLLPQTRITSDSPFFTITPSGMVQMAHRVDLEALCIDRSLCCDLEKPCELLCTVAIESESTGAIRLLELHIRILDINDNPPQFPSNQNGGQQVVEISELAELGHVINLTPATDRDLAKEHQIRRYLLHGTQLQRTFELDHTDLASVRLRLRTPLDYETTAKYKGMLEACDPRSCTSQNLTVNVVDENDNRPLFTKHSYQVTVMENATVGDTVLELKAVDKDSPANAQMSFRFHGYVDPGLRDTFRVEEDTGRIILQSRLAAQRRTEYGFAVSVDGVKPIAVGPNQAESSSTSNGAPDVAKVMIKVHDLNDFSPQIRMFSPAEGQVLTVPENAAPQRVCVVQVTDDDVGENAQVSCNILGPKSITDTFTLTGSGKYYTLSTTRVLDAELESRFTVKLVCSDAGNPPRSISRDLLVKVDDVNEYSPQLLQSTYRASVFENAKAGTEVVRIQAKDRDQSAKLHYDLKAEGKQYFGIDPSSGVIFALGDTGTQTSTVLDREKTEQITLHVCVTDGPPTFGCGIEPDKDMKKDLSDSGSSFTSTVHTASATVFVTVLDENDNKPIFTQKGPFSVTENQPRFTQLRGQLSAMDPDEGVNGRVRYSLRKAWVSADGTPASDLFQVDSQGIIRTMDVLDREKTNAYTLELVACDSAPKSPQCTSLNASVTVDDENDNKPVWHYPHEQDKEVNITADLPPGHLIVRIRASDRDSGDNGRVMYTLIDPHKRTVFEVDNYTGDVAIASVHHTPDSLTGALDSDSQSPLLPGIYRLRLRASDMGHPQHSTETWLQVNVFGPQIMANAGLNFMIIVVMVAVTGLISICLVIAIICVRRRSNSLRNRGQRSHLNGLRRSRAAGDGAEGANFPLKHEYGYPIDGTGYMMGISPTPSDLDTLKFGYPHPSSHTVMGAANGGPDSALYGWTGHSTTAGLCYPTETMKFYPESSIAASTNPDQGQTATLRLPVYRLSPTGEQIRMMQNLHDGGVPASNCLSFASSSSPIPDQLLVGSSAYPIESYPDRVGAMEDGSHGLNGQTEYHGVQNGQYTTSRCSFTPLSSGSTTNSVCCHPMGTGARRYIGGSLAHCELDVESADSGRGASEDDPNHITIGPLVHFYPSFQLPYSALPVNSINDASSEVHIAGSMDKSLFDVHVPESGTVPTSASIVPSNCDSNTVTDRGNNIENSEDVGEIIRNGWSCTSERHRLKC